jgi:hypothetical protein
MVRLPHSRTLGRARQTPNRGIAVTDERIEGRLFGLVPIRRHTAGLGRATIVRVHSYLASEGGSDVRGANVVQVAACKDDEPQTAHLAAQALQVSAEDAPRGRSARGDQDISVSGLEQVAVDAAPCPEGVG